LIGCVGYRSREIFARDQAKHLNEPEWFEGPILYGFSFKNAAALPFRKYPGWMRFFPVGDGVPGKTVQAK
jgi:hypothetical protein